MATLDYVDFGFVTTSTPPQVGGACPANTQIRVQTWSAGAVPLPAERNVLIAIIA